MSWIMVGEGDNEVNEMTGKTYRSWKKRKRIVTFVGQHFRGQCINFVSF